MDVYWLEQNESDVAEHNNWLGPRELVRLDGFRVPKRRIDWRLGRWTAKCAVAAWKQLPFDSSTLAKIEIRASDSGAPEVFMTDQPAGVTLSLSHRAGISACAVSEAARLGCDLELTEPRSDGFVEDYFTLAERDLIVRAWPEDRFRLIALLWSGKESALKAMRQGLRLDTRCVVVRPELAHSPNCWTPLQVHADRGDSFQGWWKEDHSVVRTLVADPPPNQPTLLQLSAYGWSK